MANYLKPERKKMVLDLLVEGNSIRGISRITGTHVETTIRLLRTVGARCESELDRRLRNVEVKRVQADELFCFVSCKDKRLEPKERGGERGTQFVFVAIDADSKLVPCYLIGKRNEQNAWTFIDELLKRTRGRFQLTTDSFNGYNDIDTQVFRRRVDYARLIKIFENKGEKKRERYSPATYVRLIPSIVCGNPDPKHISTSYVERQNLTMRMQMRRFARLSNAFSKKLDCLKAALAIHFWHYNFCRSHLSLRMTPAMAAGIAQTFSTWDEVLD